MINHLFKILISSTVLLGISACGGGGGGDSDPSTTALTGQFIDSPVEGLKYKTETLSGVTDAQGNFSYQDGEFIQFMMGGMTLGGAPARKILTPYDITIASQYPEIAATTLAQLLMTFDSDNNPDNGITLKPEAEGMAAANLSDPTAVQAALSAALPGVTLVDATTATQHLDNSMEELTSVYPAVDDTYNSVLVSNSTDAACSNSYQSISLNMINGEISSGEITRSDGTVEQLGRDTSGKLVTANGSQITSLRLYSGSVTGPRVGVEDTFTLLSVPSTSMDYCHATFTLRQESAVNEAPLVYHPSPKMEGICQFSDASQPNSTTLYFTALELDGYFSSKMIFTYTIDGKPPVNLIGNWQSAWDNIGQTNALSDEFTVDKLCGEGFDWKLTVTDNDGAVSSLQGRIEPQVEGAIIDEGTTGNNASCLENYPTSVCDNMIANTTNVSSYPAGSCSTLIPNPAVVIDMTDPLSYEDSDFLLTPQIQLYPTGSDTVSCLIDN